MGDSLFYLSIACSGARLMQASQTGKEIIPEAAVISAEYAGCYLGGATGAKVGGMIGSVAGPVGGLIGAVGGSILGSYYGFVCVKSQEKVVEETTKDLTQKLISTVQWQSKL